jgi:hypothetical protein
MAMRVSKSKASSSISTSSSSHLRGIAVGPNGLEGGPKTTHDPLSRRRHRRDTREDEQTPFTVPDRQNLPHLVLTVRRRADDHQSIQQIERQTVGRLVLRAANLGDAAVRRRN